MNENTVRKMAHLARLHVDNHDIPSIAKQLTKIIHLVEEIDQTNTDNIEPMSHPLDLVQGLREDEIIHSDQSQAFLALAPAVEANLYLVPKVIDPFDDPDITK